MQALTKAKQAYACGHNWGVDSFADARFVQAFEENAFGERGILHVDCLCRSVRARFFNHRIICDGAQLLSVCTVCSQAYTNHK
jgi:hypothetical protein